LRGKISSFKEFCDLNTFFLSPKKIRELIFGKKVGIIVSEVSKSVFEDLKQLYNVLRDEEQFRRKLEAISKVDERIIPCLFYLSGISFELLGRLFIFLDKIFEEKKLQDNCELYKLIKVYKYGGERRRRKKLGYTSNEIKKRLKDNSYRLIVIFILAKIIFGKLSVYLSKNITCNDKTTMSIIEQIKVIFDNAGIFTRKILSKLCENSTKFISIIVEELIKRAEKGGLSAIEGYSYEDVIEDLLKEHDIKYDRTTKRAKSKRKEGKRIWDFYIPNRKNAKIVVEISYMITTSSAQTIKTEEIASEAKKGKKIYMILDGAGWIARASDTKKYLNTGAKIFTFHPESLPKFIEFIKKEAESSY